MLTDCEKRAATLVWERTSNYRWWQPKDRNAPLLCRLIEEGYLERCDARFGVEAIKDAAVRWTGPGRELMKMAA